MNKRKNIALGVASTFLLLALFDGWEYGFFTMLRFIVCISCSYVALIAYQCKSEKWIWIFVGIAILFNPLIPMRFSRETWVVIDLIISMFLLASLFIFKLSDQKNA